ncbi:MAG: TonB-dependent receptor plug domain-containing protein [Bacteroidota bacterium]
MRHLIILFSLCSVLAFPLVAQDRQESNELQVIEQAQSHVAKGQFREALALLEGNNFRTPNGQRASRVLMIKVYFVQDRLEEATEMAKKLLISQPGYEPELTDRQGYKDLIVSVRSQLSSQTIASVSKIAERPEEAPATVYIITKEEMIRRGYNGLIELLKDQPGFDIMGFYSATYTNIYQRGYRSTNTERTLLLIDGVEENDLYFNIPYISRQYPISNIERVEIIYGPASTMYGPNAFVGVINVVTKKFTGKNNRPTGEVHFGTGSYNTYWTDLSLGGTSKSGRVQWNVTGRAFWSDEMDLSDDPLVGKDFDYAATEFDTTSRYDSLMVIEVGEDTTLADLGIVDTNGYLTETVADGTRTISLSEAGLAAVRAADKALYENGIDGQSVNGFSNSSFNYYLRAQVSFDRLSITAQHWTREEGTSARYRDVVAGPSGNGSVWTPQNYTLTLKYATPLNNEGTWTFSSLTSYRYHRLQPTKSNILFSRNYWRGNYDIYDLVSTDDPTTFADDVIWVDRNFFQEARQLRTEQKFVYAATEQLSWVSGLEIRNTQMQGDYIVSYDTVNVEDRDTGCDTWPNPQECGVVSSNQEEGGNQYGMWDLGLYSQAQWKVLPSLKLVGGSRLDYNRIRSDEGFGWAFNPRLALVYTPRNWVLKAIYARGIQNPSQWSKFSTGGTRIPSVNLQEEVIRNFEASAYYTQTNSAGEKLLTAEVSGYYSAIDNVVGLRKIGTSVTQNANIGEFDIYGVQVVGTWRIRPNLSLWGNYSYTQGRVSRIVDGIDSTEVSDAGFEVNNIIADIAPHQAKLGVSGSFLDNRLKANVRSQYVSARPTGGGTTNPDNNGQESTTKGDFFSAYLLLNATIGWDFSQWISDNGAGNGLTAQVSFFNITNQSYYNTGPLNGDGVTNPSLIPQRGFHSQFRLLYNF